VLDVYLDVSGLVFVYLVVLYNYCNLSIFLYIFGTNGDTYIWIKCGVGCMYSG